MKRTGRLALLAPLAGVLLMACTADGNGSTGRAGPTTSAATTTSTVPTPAETFTGAPGTAVYEYALDGLVVTMALDGSIGTLSVENGTPHDLDAPDVYVRDAVDGHRIEGEVSGSAPVAAGETVTFDVTLDGIGVDDIGLLVLLFGSDNYGAFVRTG